ncbi:hypothetical protein BJY01DRAFT_212006 [Aspergillus pseudoustus]|uniref:Uncharacterized protein n=1 Tax=Aspergillus pseudoustus TaxID=1810923 RepID=A0ABR4K810_9EURO
MFRKEGVLRRYMYSKTDVMVPWEAVLEHAEEGRKVLGVRKGIIEVTEFLGSGHVELLAIDPEGYRRVIEGVL